MKKTSSTSEKFQILEEKKSIMYTPDDVAEKIVNYCSRQMSISDSVLEPFNGNGSIYKKILNHKKYYCEIDEGIDFFLWNDKIDWIISNPPFQIKINGEVVNAFIMIIDRCMELCNKGFFFLINHKLWSSLTVKRLKDWEQQKGFVLSRIHIFEIKQWYGRYYLVKFEKNGESLFDY